jgi:hypothetical protein
VCVCVVCVIVLTKIAMCTEEQYETENNRTGQGGKDRIRTSRVGQD